MNSKKAKLMIGALAGSLFLSGCEGIDERYQTIAYSEQMCAATCCDNKTALEHKLSALAEFDKHTELKKSNSFLEILRSNVNYDAKRARAYEKIVELHKDKSCTQHEQ